MAEPRKDTYGYTFIDGPTVDDQRTEMERVSNGARPRYVECGCCGAFHLASYGGDCRNDLYRIDEPDALHGHDKWDLA